MSRTPQPMRRMRYLIAEVIRQADIAGADLIALTRGDSWLAGGFLAGPEAVSPHAFIFEISPRLGEWVMWLHLAQNPIVPVFGTTLLTAPGPETVWIGPNLVPLQLPNRAATLRETLRLAADI